VSEGERVGVIGPNGSGKSTLLEILQGRVTPDSGDVAIRKGMRIALVQQVSEFTTGETVRAIVDRGLDRGGVAESERRGRTPEVLGRAGFADLEVEAATLSGGWSKRLAIVEALVQRPDVRCWMSRRITWTWQELNGWRACCGARRLRAWW
jgi:ATP-binding cassette subfamily F protein uup